MSTVIFDFDSTLINCESLEVILQPVLQHRPELEAQFKHLTDLGMNGEISFKESLQRRLALATPTRQAVQSFAASAAQYLTPGIQRLIRELQHNGVSVWIISGGLFDAIAPLARQLNIPVSQVLAVNIDWDAAGSFLQIKECDICSESKVMAAQKVAVSWSKPSVMIGDGMTDYAVYLAGLSNYFIAYTEHVQRPALAALPISKARNAEDLSQTLHTLLQPGNPAC